MSFCLCSAAGQNVETLRSTVVLGRSTVEELQTAILELEQPSPASVRVNYQAGDVLRETKKRLLRLILKTIKLWNERWYAAYAAYFALPELVCLSVLSGDLLLGIFTIQSYKCTSRVRLTAKPIRPKLRKRFHFSWGLDSDPEHAPNFAP